MALLLLAALFVISPFFGPFTQSPQLGDAARFTSVEIEMIDWGKPADQRSTFVSSTDSEAIAKLIRTLESGERILDCKCLGSGYIRLRDAMDEDEVIELVPGHGEDTYDIRYDDRRFELDRSRLSAALEAMDASLPIFEKPRS